VRWVSEPLQNIVAHHALVARKMSGGKYAPRNLTDMLLAVI